jgi:hypothetical protein
MNKQAWCKYLTFKKYLEKKTYFTTHIFFTNKFHQPIKSLQKEELIGSIM